MDIIKNLYLHKYTNKMFYKNRQSSSNANSRRSTTSSINNGPTRQTDRTIRAQQFYIYTIDTSGRNQIPDQTLDLPPKYEDVIKEPHLYRTTREVA